MLQNITNRRPQQTQNITKNVVPSTDITQNLDRSEAKALEEQLKFMTARCRF